MMTDEPPGGDQQGQGHLAVVTGASGGLGRALSVAFTRRGVRVVGLARRAHALDETRSLCPEGTFSSFVADVADPVRVREVFSEVEARIGPVTILVNNAAIYPRVDFLSAPAEEVLEQLSVNLGGYVNCASAALAYMAARGRGRIVNVSSFAGEGPIPGSLGYSVSKGGDRILTRALAVETRDRLPGLIVTEWMPGILATKMGDAAGIDPAVAAEWGVSLALAEARNLHGATFVRDRVLIQPLGRRARLKNRLRQILPSSSRQA